MKKEEEVEVDKEAKRQYQLKRIKVSNGYVAGYAGYVNLCRIAPSLYWKTNKNKKSNNNNNADEPKEEREKVRERERETESAQIMSRRTEWRTTGMKKKRTEPTSFVHKYNIFIYVLCVRILVLEKV